MATQEYKMAMDLLTAHDSVIIALHIVVRIIMVIINLIRSEKLGSLTSILAQPQHQ